MLSKCQIGKLGNISFSYFLHILLARIASHAQSYANGSQGDWIYYDCLSLELIKIHHAEGLGKSSFIQGHEEVRVLKRKLGDGEAQAGFAVK